MLGSKLIFTNTWTWPGGEGSASVALPDLASTRSGILQTRFVPDVATQASVVVQGSLDGVTYADLFTDVLTPASPTLIHFNKRLYPFMRFTATLTGHDNPATDVVGLYIEE